MTGAITPAHAIVVDRLSKRFDAVTAVDNVSFSVPVGSTTALLGGNGAGKTTTLSILLGLLTPTSGSVTVLGADMLRPLPGSRQDELLLAICRFATPPHPLREPDRLRSAVRLRASGRRIRELARDLDLEAFLKRPTGSLSAGQRTRVALAKALLNRPRLLLLDEPTASLDPDTADTVRSYLERYRAASGATIMLASHNMAEVERLCDHVLMMRAGRIVDRGGPRELIGRYGRRTMEEVFLDIARDRSATAARDSKAGAS